MTSPTRRHIGISLGMIDSLTDGLGEFSTQICQRIVSQAPAWRSQGIHFHLHMPSRWHGSFGDAVSYLPTHRRHGYWHWQGLRRFDVWHGLNQLGRIIPPWRTRHAVLTIHDLNMVYALPDAEMGLRKLRRRLTHFDEVTTLTRYVEGDVRKHLGWQGEVTVIPNGARDLSQHVQEPIVGIPAGPFFLHLSRMAPSKNPQCILDLAAAWPQRQFVLAGPTNKESDALKTQANDRALSNLSVVQDVTDAQKAWLYAHCDGLLFPSQAEGFGLPPIEAMHFGKPVFLSRLTSLPEIGGPWAGYFDHFDPVSMRATIERETPRLASQSEAIRAHAAQFNWDRAALSYLALYRRALDGSAP